LSLDVDQIVLGRSDLTFGGGELSEHVGQLLSRRGASQLCFDVGYLIFGGLGLIDGAAQLTDNVGELLCGRRATGRARTGAGA
jgi:hypothetical protein